MVQKKKPSLRQLKQAFDIFSNMQRLRILRELRSRRTLTVGELAERLGASDQNISQHLRILRLVDIVKTTRRGKFKAYRIALSQTPLAKVVLGMV